MKRIMLIIQIFVIVFSLCVVPASADITSIETNNQYELWTQSPYRTSGMSLEEIKLQQAIEMNMLKMYELPELGEKYFFAAAEGQMSNTGKNGKSDLSLYYYYLLLTTEDGYIIIECCAPWSSYYWSGGQLIADVSDMTVETEGSSRVLYVISPADKYKASEWDNYNDYAFITEDKRMSFETRDDTYSQGGFPIMYEGKLYWGNDSYMKGTSFMSYHTSDGETAMRMTSMNFKNGTIEFGASSNHKLSDVTEANGYTLFDTYENEVSSMNFYKIPYTEDLYALISYPCIYNESEQKYYYDDRIDIYRCENGNVKKINSKFIDVKRDDNKAYKVTEIGGIDENFYESEGKPVPAMNIGDRYIITDTGEIAELSLDDSIYYYYNLALYNGRLVVIRNKNYTSYINFTENGTSVSKQAINYINFESNGTILLDEDIYLELVSGGNPGQDGFYYPISSYTACSTFKEMSKQNVKDWWGGFKGNVFDDGRTVTGEWIYSGNYYELWYKVTKADGTICAHGPTGYMVSSSKAEKELCCIAIGDSKFIVCYKDIVSDFAKEYYRVAIVNETADGNVTSSASIGNKTLTPPANTDTIPVQSVIDFGKEQLPIGYNIKDNVVSSEKLDSTVREQINAIRLNDIVIVKNTETASGTQNTGTTLNAFEEYETSVGDAPIIIYSNGQNFCWYCSEVDALTPGVYNKNYTVGDRVIYVTYKIVEAPDNDGVTTVVF